MIEFQRLVDLLQQESLLIEAQGPKHIPNIERPANDSRKVGLNDVFVAIQGESVDGHVFIEKAVKNGAIAIVCEAMPEGASQRFPGIAFIQVDNARAALAVLAAHHFGTPSDHLHMIGVTGTNGKTTTAFLIYHMLSTLSAGCGLISTIENRIGSTVKAATHTTPDALDMHALFQEMVEAQCSACAMEVSSHALSQERVRTINYASAIFTNLTQDHLDYHGTMARYLAAKKRLFDDLSPNATAIYNTDDPAGQQLVTDSRGQKISYGLHTSADFTGRLQANELGGLVMEIEGRASRFKLVGLFNAYNLLAAYAAGRSAGYAREQVLEALSMAPPIPGRFEILHVSKARYVIVDYAHTPDALENVLRATRQTMSPDANLWCLFGCGGDRDQQKRPLMGQIAEQLSDRIIVTSDNPRTEDPEHILHDIRQGMSSPETALWITNRREAITEAAEQSANGDVILIAGKGHEPYQVIGTEQLPFDDREEAIKAFSLPSS